MGYANNVLISIPMAIIIYMLTEKAIINLTCDANYTERVQKSFVIGFVLGLTFIAFGMTVFDETSNIDNKALQLAMYGAGAFLILNSAVFSWSDLDESTKMIILGISIISLIVYSYHNKNGQIDLS